MVLRTQLKGPNVNLSTVLAVETILRGNGEPLSRNEILRRLANRSRSLTRQKLNTILRYLESHGLTGEASRGVQWIANRDLKVLAAIAAGVRVR